MYISYVGRYRKTIRIMVSVSATSNLCCSKLAEVRKQNSGQALLNMIAAVLAHR
jgi:hypothetical protein